jgi:hypothetical protein
MWLLVDDSTRSIGGTIPISLRHWTVIVRTGSSAPTILVSFNRMGPNPGSFSACSNGLQRTCDYSWMNSTRSIGGTIPISLTHWGPLLYVQALPAQLFWYLSGWALTLCSFSARSMGLNVYVTTRGGIQLTSIGWDYPHFFETLEPLLYVQALPAQLFLVSFNWDGLTFGSFSACSMGCNITCTRGWIQLAVLELSPLLWHIGMNCVRTGSSSSDYFWYLSTRMGPNDCFSSTLNGLQRTCDYSWMNSTHRY